MTVVRRTICCFALACCIIQVRAADTLNVDQTYKLLIEYQRQTWCSVNCQRWALPRLKEERPVDQLLELFDSREILWLGGTSWGAVCSAVESDRLVDALIARLEDPSPWWRVYSVQALGVTRSTRAIAGLTRLLDDETVLGEPPKQPRTVPRPLGNPPVAWFAANALAGMGRDEGVLILLDHAEWTSKQSWATDVPEWQRTKAFRELSGMDFGTDWDAWREWFLADGAKAVGLP